MKNSLSVVECTAEEYAATLSGLEYTIEPISFLQAPFYGAWQQRDGKTVIYYAARQDGKTIAAGLAVKYDAPGGISFFYSPYGPIAQDWSPALLDAIRTFWSPIAKKTGATFIRLDSRGLTDVAGVEPVRNHLAVTASLQPRNEWVLDITPVLETISAGFTQHTRYNIRLAERANAKVDIYTPAEAPMDIIAELMQTTAGRDKFSLLSREYYEGVLASIPPADGFVAVCSIDDKPAAFGIFAAYDNMVHYVYAGSSNEFRKIAPPYFLIWHAILESKKRGWTVLNFGGITDAVKGTHLAGVTSFKKRFGGYEVVHSNPVDLVYKHSKYWVFSLYKRLS